MSIFEALKEGKVKILKSKEESEVIGSENILTNQLQGKGQIV